MILDEAFLAQFEEQFGNPGRALSMLVRPAFVAEPRHTLVWGDWSAIEARGLPWLANSPGGEEVLEVFRRSDKDHSQPDIYMITGCKLVGKDPVEMWARYLDKDPEAKQIRQAYGKVPTLSLGYGGALGALQAMAVNYKVYLDDETAARVVKGWRADNPWAPTLWHTLWGAAIKAYNNPMTPFKAGRVTYIYVPGLLEGSLICILPCGRPLTYPHLRWRRYEIENKMTGEKEIKEAFTYKKQYGYSALWYGKLAENITQAACASILRETLVQLDKKAPSWMPVIGHTHDEIVVEVPDEERKIEDARETLTYYMTEDIPWRKGFPLVTEITDSWFYTKAE